MAIKKKIPAVDLPTVIVKERFERNPDWNPKRSSQFNDPENPFYLPQHDVEAEVLSIHLQKGTMRVRILSGRSQQGIIDTPIQPFLEKYKIVPR